MTVKGAERLKIALLLPELRIGGAQRVFLTLTKEFLDSGVLVDLIVMSGEGELLLEVPENVNLVILSNPPFSKTPFTLIRFFYLLGKYLRNNSPDALLSTLTGTNLMAVVARVCSFSKTRLVLREAVSLANVTSPLKLFFMRLLYSRADVIVALSDFMRNELIESLSLPADKIVTIPNPVDIKRIEYSAKEPLPHDFDTSIPYAVAVGRLAPQKDYKTLIEAFVKLAENNCDLRLVIIGEGPDRHVLEDLIHLSSLQKKIELRGFDENPIRWIAKSELFVLSSRWEGYPNSLLEAVSIGVPVVSTCYDSSVYSLLSKAKGTVVPIGDSDALAEKILSLYQQKDSKLEKTQLPDGVATASKAYLELLTDHTLL